MANPEQLPFLGALQLLICLLQRDDFISRLRIGSGLQNKQDLLGQVKAWLHLTNCKTPGWQEEWL